MSDEVPPASNNTNNEEESPSLKSKSNDDDNDAPAASQETHPSSDSPPTQDATSTSPPPPTEEKKQRAVVVAPLPLEWTRMAECNEPDTNPANIVRYPWDVMEIDPTDTQLTVVGTAGQKITRMGSNLSKNVSPNLTHLVLRSHLIRTMEGIAGMKQLELLELYDNMVDELRELDGGEEDGLPGRGLRVLDISYNVIRDMGPVSFCPNLQELYIAQNKIKTIKGLKQLKLLRKIDLGANRIRVMDEEELSGLVNLEELWLGKNKIEHIGGLSKLTKLRRLDVQSNRLTKIENLEAQVNTLEELYLAHNAIDIEGGKCETGLALQFTQLNTVDLTRNRLTDTSPFAHLTSLSDLWISGNDIKTFEDVEHLRGLTELDAVYLEYNPVASEFEYRKKIAALVPSLTQIDANMIGGLAQHGYMSVGGGGGESLVERMRQMQDVAIRKAKLVETEGQEADAETFCFGPEMNGDKSDEKEVTDETDEQNASAETVEQPLTSETEEQKAVVKTEENE